MLINATAMRIPLADETVQCVVTSPPYWGLRSYGIGVENGELGLEPTPDEYVANMIAAFREVRRVLRPDGIAWVNLGDSYVSRPQTDNFGDPKAMRRLPENRCRANCGGLKPKDLCMIPARVALALQADGWWLRSDCIWAKPNPMPESVTDRPTTAHEHVFLLTKSACYFYDADGVREPVTESSIERAAYSLNSNNSGFHKDARTGTGYEKCRSGQTMEETGLVNRSGRNLRTVWTLPTKPYSGAHYATFPVALAERCINVATSDRGCCPVCGAPWVRVVERFENPGGINGGGHREPGRNTALAKRERDYENERNMGTVSTIGWRPSCDHGAAPAPCIVLDPFCGSGTVGEACRGLRRRFVGIDLSARYLAENALPRAEMKTCLATVAELPLFSAGSLP